MLGGGVTEREPTPPLRMLRDNGGPIPRAWPTGMAAKNNPSHRVFDALRGIRIGAVAGSRWAGETH